VNLLGCKLPSRRWCGKSEGGACSYAEFRGVIGSYFPHLAARFHRVFSDLGSNVGRAHPEGRRFKSCPRYHKINKLDTLRFQVVWEIRRWR